MKISKADLRKLARKKRRSLNPEQQSLAARELLVRLRSIPLFSGSKKIALYLANDGEIDPIEVMKWCWKSSRETYVPIIIPENKLTLLFANVTEETKYTENRFGIREPVVANNELISGKDLDLVLMPLVSFDLDGNRVGMGGGYYDTTFSHLKNSSAEDKPQLIGIAHDCQKEESIFADQWDVPLAIVVTDKSVYLSDPKQKQ